MTSSCSVRALEDVEDPIKAALVTAAQHVGPDVGGVDGGGFGYEADALGAVFLDMLGCAGVDEVEF